MAARIKAPLVAVAAWCAIQAFASLGCAPKGGSATDCTEQVPASACCDPTVYANVSITELARDPGKHIGTRVQATGYADWYDDPRQIPACDCAGTVCSCVTRLGLRSAACGTAVPLAGVYRGVSVQCGPAGCWPLSILGEFTVCGIWAVSDPGNFGAIAALVIDSYCQPQAP